jgi:hypothetical protein
MVSLDALRGYLLEEVLAKLLLANGYRLLVSAAQDPDALKNGRHGLLVRGRGSDHQADVLGELVLPTPFSLPLRIFVEAKYRKRKTGLPEVRNAHGVIHDVNEQYSTAKAGSRRVPVRRHLYRYALFSTSGFSRPAQQYGLAQQIFLVDLSGAAFEPLTRATDEAATQLIRLLDETDVPFPRGQIRTALRLSLGTWTDTSAPSDSRAGEQRLRTLAQTAPVSLDDGDPLEPVRRMDARESSLRNPAREEKHTLPPDDLAAIAETLADEVNTTLMLGFPASPFILVLRPDGLAAFGDYVREHSTEVFVDIRPAGARDVSGDWVIVPADGSGRFALWFSLPALLQDWLLEDEASVALRARDVTAQLLSSIFVFHNDQLVRLTFRPRRRG